jgi:hypothetical protein
MSHALLCQNILGMFSDAAAVLHSCWCLWSFSLWSSVHILVVFYWSLSMEDIAFLYSFCSCGLILYGECGTFTGGCVELMNLRSKPIVQTLASVKY